MAKIQFSKESFAKLKSSQLDKETANLLDKFSPDRPEPKRKTITNKQPTDSSINKNTVKQSRKALKRQLRRIRQAHGIPAPKNTESTTKRLARKMARIELEKQKLERVRRISDQAKSESHFSIFSPGLSSAKSSSNSRQRAKTKPIYDTRGNDAYNFAGEYSARNVEYGHGRRKTDEWNDTTAYDLNNKLNELRKIQKEDPNTFDRGAMK